MASSYRTRLAARAGVVASLTLAWAVAACSDSTAPEPVAATIAVTPPADTIEVGQTLALQAVVRDQHGETMIGESVTWTSGDGSLATVTNAGLVTGLSPGGPVTITAASGGVSGGSEVLVRSDCTDAEAIQLDGTGSGMLSSTDCILSDGSFVDPWTLDLSTAARVRITMTSTAVNAYLGLANLTTGQIVAEDDDSGGGTNAMIEIDLGAGPYLILANSLNAAEFGSYNLAVTEVSAALTAEAAPARGGQLRGTAGTDWRTALGEKPGKR